MKTQVKKHNLGYKMSGDMRQHPMRGTGFFDDVFSGIKSVVGPVLDIAKSTGAISKIAGAFGQPEIAGVASALGYGRKRGRKRGGRMHGKGLESAIMKC